MDIITAMQNALSGKEARLQSVDAERSSLVHEIAKLRVAVEVALGIKAEQSAALEPMGDIPILTLPQADQSEAERTSSSVSVILADVQRLLTKGPMHTPALLAALTSGGIKIGGSDQAAHLSTILSRNKAAYGLQSDRRVGWAVVKPPPSTIEEAMEMLK